MKLSLERKIALGFGSAVLLLLLVTSVAAWNALRFRGSYVWIRQAYEVFIGLDQVLTELLSMEASTRGFELTGDDELLRPYQSGTARFDEHLRTLRRLVAENSRQLPQMERLDPLATRIKENMQQRIAERRDRGIAASSQATLLRSGQHMLAEFWTVVRAMAGEERDLLTNRLREAYEVGRLTILTAIAATLLAFGAVALAALHVRRDLLRARRDDAALQESFKRVEDLYNHAPCGYHSLDATGTFVAINDTALAWLGYVRDEVVGKMTFSDVLAPTSQPLFAERYRHFMQTGAAQNVEYEWRRKDGSTLPILLNATAIYDEAGRYRASRATVFDVTRRRRAENERDRFFILSRDLLCVAGFDGYFRRLNPAWEATLGFTTAELMAQPFTEFVHPADLAATHAEAERLARGDESVSFENRYRCKDGSYRWLLWSARPVAAEKLIYASARDITDRKEIDQNIQRLNDTLAKRADELEAANRELESFSYSVSHDLRAPLRHIDGYAALLTKRSVTTLDDESRRFVGTISRAAKQMGMLIDDLLAFSRIGRVSLRLESVAHNDLVTQVIADERFASGDRQIQWEQGDLPNVRADPALLRQVWVNLIDNAVKYSGNQPQPKITIAGRLDPSAGEYVFFVRDNGVGFDMAYADKLFGVFQRLHGPAEFEGTGIGLANVRRIVTRHGGRTWAEGRVGEGAIFYFSIPLTVSSSHSSG